jgi:hypothetical protein
MRQVRFVKQGAPPLSADHVVLETVDGQEQFVLLVDSAMRDAVRADLPRPNGGTPPPARISPREIQTRVRAGETPETLAAENDMTLERVMRFAGPVIEERSRIAGEAKRARARRDGEGLPVPFGETVDERFTAHGIDPSSVRWDAKRGEDAQWVVSATWIAADGLGGETDRTAEWSFALGPRQVTPIDDTAGDLLSNRPLRPIVPVRPPDAMHRPIATVVPPTVPGVVAFPAQPHADTGKIPNIAPFGPELFDQDALPPAPPEARRRRGYDEPLPLALPEPTPVAKVTNLGVAHRGEGDLLNDDRAEKARIPSWDDILLGVRRKGD